MVYAVVGFTVGVLLSGRHTVYAVLLAHIPLLGIIVTQTCASGWPVIALSTLAGCGSLQLGFFAGAFTKFIAEPAPDFAFTTTEQPAVNPVAKGVAAKLVRTRPTDLR